MAVPGFRAASASVPIPPERRLAGPARGLPGRAEVMTWPFARIGKIRLAAAAGWKAAPGRGPGKPGLLVVRIVDLENGVFVELPFDQGLGLPVSWPMTFELGGLPYELGWSSDTGKDVRVLIHRDGGGDLSFGMASLLGRFRARYAPAGLAKVGSGADLLLRAEDPVTGDLLFWRPDSPSFFADWFGYRPDTLAAADGGAL